MAEKQTFTYYLTIDVEAMNEDSAMKKLEGWVEPTLALKKNSDLELTSVEYDEPEEDEEAPEAEPKTSIVQSAMKKKARPELKIPQKDDFDYDNIPDWDELGDDEAEEPVKKAEVIDLSEEDDLDSLLSSLDDDEEAEEAEDSDDDDEDWDWDEDGEW